MSAEKKALVVSYAPVENDARVGNQIRWLESAGYCVDVLSQGPEHPDSTGRPLRIRRPALPVRLAMHLLLPPAVRFRWMVQAGLPAAELRGCRFDAVVVNDHHLLPWAVVALPAMTAGPLVLDVHELNPNVSSSLFYTLRISRYIDWLMTFISSPIFTSRLTVAEGIADLHRDARGIARPGVIRNVVPYERLEASPVDPDCIVLVHHGYAVIERGIDVMLDAALRLEPRFRLVLMVLGDARTIAALRSHPAVAAGRVEFRSPVAVTDVARAVNGYDLELAFFPPRSTNNRHALPNKFFEAVQGRLGVVIGRSPEMVPLVERYGFGLIVEGWDAAHLATALNGLTAEDVVALKRATSAAAVALSAQSEGERFLAELGL